MKLLWLLLYLFCFSQLAAQYICPPCNLACDSLSFAEPGICEHCNMVLIADPSYQAIDKDINPILSAIRAESETNSSLSNTLIYLSDVYGPRLMGTKQYYQGLEWVRESLKSWNIQEVELQSFDRKHRGWELKSFAMDQIAPSYGKIRAFPAAYTKPTQGEVAGTVLYLNHWQEIFDYEGQLQGKIVLLGDTYFPVQSYNRPMVQRLDSVQLQEAAENPDPNHRVIGYLSRRSINQAIRGRYNQRERMKSFFKFAEQEGVLALVEASNFHYGILHVDGNGHFPSYFHLDDIQPLASFVIANEHFGRLKRLLDLGLEPILKLHLDTEYYYEPAYNQNLIAKLPGTDPLLREESVIIGAHFDSWHAGTGAIDNASGVAVMMEALRILQVLDLPMKRTVEMALWGGEEQVFAGSLGYVDQNIGNIESGQLKEKAAKVSAYLNLDNGSGQIRGIYAMGNDKAMPIFEKFLKPFPGNANVTIQYANQTDHELFDRLNIPAFQFIQDPLDYMTAIHHTNLDVYEYVNQVDIAENAVMMAYLIYQIANHESLLPRKINNSPAPSKTGNTTVSIAGYPDAKQVNIIGTFNNWNLFGTNLYKTENGWECKLDLEPGEYLYKFYIDGDFIADPTTAKADLKKDGKGHAGLTLLKVASN